VVPAARAGLRLVFLVNSTRGREDRHGTAFPPKLPVRYCVFSPPAAALYALLRVAYADL
jgi:hypothetical protein